MGLFVTYKKNAINMGRKKICKNCNPCDPCFKSEPTGSKCTNVNDRIKSDLKSYEDKLSEKEIEILIGLPQQEFYK